MSRIFPLVFMFMFVTMATPAGARILKAKPLGSNTAYDILGVANDASPAEIKSAFRKLAMDHHPDRGGRAEDHKKYSEAYSKINSAHNRAVYDYSIGLGRRPADMARGTRIAEIELRSMLEQSKSYTDAIQKALTDDPALYMAASQWASFPLRLRNSFLPQIRNPVSWIDFALTTSMVTSALSADSAAGAMLWATLAFAFSAIPTFDPARPTYILYTQVYPRPSPGRLINEYATSLDSASDKLRASLVTFDLLYTAALQGTHHAYAKWQDIYVQLRLDKMARKVPAVAIGQLIRFLGDTDSPDVAVWKETFKDEMRSRPKYWLARLDVVQSLIKDYNLPGEYKVRADVYAEELREQTRGKAIKQRLTLHAKRACEVALQMVAELTR